MSEPQTSPQTEPQTPPTEPQTEPQQQQPKGKKNPAPKTEGVPVGTSGTLFRFDS